MRYLLSRFAFIFAAATLAAHAHNAAADWFDDAKRNASDEQLHQLLHQMPKGGDLHLHTTGSMHPEWWYEHAVNVGRGYEYYTRVRIDNCRDYDFNQFGVDPYLLYFRTVNAHRLASMSECERGEFVALKDLTDEQREGWQDALRLDQPHEGRAEFFETHWQRLGDLVANPHLVAGLLARYMKDAASDGMLYIEPQVLPFGHHTGEGEPISAEGFAEIVNARLAQRDVQRTGMTWRFQVAILRFTPDAEESLRQAYDFASRVRPWVAVNMVGREDNDKGYPLRFLPTLRDLRRTYNNVRLSIHGGEVDEPNHHVRDTLLLGADRIGHGLNLITDPETLLLMRGGPYLIEINLVSNRLLNYVNDYADHPFPEYLRLGVPVALSTDDRGMWSSTMTDEFFVAVKEFNLSWEEVKTLSRNSLRHAFLPEDEKARLLDEYERRIAAFERSMARGWRGQLSGEPSPKLGFVCRQYNLCAEPAR